MSKGPKLKNKKVTSVAGRVPIRCLSDYFPGCTFTTIDHEGNSKDNRVTVKLVLPSRANAEFTGSGKIEKIAQHNVALAVFRHYRIPGFDSMVSYSSVPEEPLRFQVDCIPNALSYLLKILGPHVKFSEPLKVFSPTNIPLWKVSLMVEGFHFEDTGPSKKKAKEAVAVSCLRAMNSKSIGMVTNLKHTTFEDHLANLMFNILADSTKSIPKLYLSFRNVAGLYLHNKLHPDIKRTSMIAVAAGENTTDSFVNDGSVIHNCNAEILVIRAFRKFLLKNLGIELESENAVYFTKDPDTGVYHLKDCYEVILLKNHPPSGDPYVCHSTPKQLHIKHLFNVDQSSPGALQYPVAVIKSGKQHGLQFHTYKYFEERCEIPKFVSPADKLTVYNVTGIQGELLSSIIAPVFIDKYIFQRSATVNISSLKRSFYDRLENLKLPEGFTINKPVFAICSSKPKCDKLFGCYAGWVDCNSDSLSWEILKLPEGKALSDTPMFRNRKVDETDIMFVEYKLTVARAIQNSLTPSKLCKLSFLEMYSKISKFKFLKQRDVSYQTLKILAKDFFHDNGLGSWPVRDKSVNH